MRGSIRHGSIQASISARGSLSSPTLNRQVLLEERKVTGPRRQPHFKYRNGGFIDRGLVRGYEGERLYGLGSISMVFWIRRMCHRAQQRNTEISIPFMVSIESTASYGITIDWARRAWPQRHALVAEGSQQWTITWSAATRMPTFWSTMQPSPARHRRCPNGHRVSGSASCVTRHRKSCSMWRVSISAAGCPIGDRRRLLHWTHMGDWRFEPHAGPTGAMTASWTRWASS